MGVESDVGCMAERNWRVSASCFRRARVSGVSVRWARTLLTRQLLWWKSVDLAAGTWGAGEFPVGRALSKPLTGAESAMYGAKSCGESTGESNCIFDAVESTRLVGVESCMFAEIEFERPFKVHVCKPTGGLRLEIFGA